MMSTPSRLPRYLRTDPEMQFSVGCGDCAPWIPMVEAHVGSVDGFSGEDTDACRQIPGVSDVFGQSPVVA